MNNKGFSLVESLLAVVMVSSVFVGIVSLYPLFVKGTLKSKNRSIGTNLAQEQIESLKRQAYFLILVSSDTNPNSTGYGLPNRPENGLYDKINLIGGIEFERYTFTQRVTPVGGVLTVVPATNDDTGMKLISVDVRWKEDGVQKKQVLKSVVNDPARQTLSATLTGLVSSGGQPLNSAFVQSIENRNWTTLTAATGAYTLPVSSGTYSFRATKLGYFNQASGAITFPPQSILNQNFVLDRISTGTIEGYAIYVGTMNRTSVTTAGSPGYLKISELCAQVTTTAPAEEYVELYNPTSTQIVISRTNFKLKFIANSGAVTTASSLRGSRNGNFDPDGTLDLPTTVPAFGFALLASTGTLTGAGGVLADATYLFGGPGGMDIPIDAGVGVAITDNLDVSIDSVGWNNHFGADQLAPAVAYEGTAVNPPFGVGLGIGWALERKAWSISTSTSMWNGVDVSSGNAYDTDNNNNDFEPQATASASSPPPPGPPFPTGLNPQNTLAPRISGVGPEWRGSGLALVSAADGLSSPVLASATGYFRLTGVATAYADRAPGAWDVQASSQTFNVYGTSLGVTLSLITNPPLTTWTTIYLGAVPVNGALSGRVVYATAPAIGMTGIKISAGLTSAFTDSTGRYYLAVSTGTYQVQANPAQESPGWSTELSSTVTVGAGTVAAVADLGLKPTGRVAGVVRNTNGDAVPGITIQAKSTIDPTLTREALSGIDGTYTISNVPTMNLGIATYNPYDIKPILDSNNSSIPATYGSITILQGGTTAGINFTVTSSWGSIYGDLRDTTNGNALITTGALILAATGTIPSPPAPPDITNAVRTGASVYYGVISRSDGTYTLPVRWTSGVVYNVYAWFPRVSGEETVSYDTKSVSVTMDTINKNKDISIP